MGLFDQALCDCGCFLYLLPPVAPVSLLYGGAINAKKYYVKLFKK